MKKLLYTLAFFIPILINAQQVPFHSSPSDYMWMNVGDPGFSVGTAVFTTIKFSPDDQAYVAFADWGYGKSLSVMKLNGTEWINVGNPGFSESFADWISLAISPLDGQPWVAFSDFLDYTKRASVMKFDGTDWVYVGVQGFSGSVAEYLSLSFSPSGEPYVAFCDHQVIKVSVMKFDGTNWVYVGNQGISEGMAQYSSLAFSPSGMPYVAYTEYDNNWKTTVMKFNGTGWENVGSTGFSAGSAEDLNLAFSPTGEPYVAYSDGGNSDKATVMKLDGSNWVNVGNAGFSAGWAFGISLAFNPADGRPSIAFGDAVNASKATVMQFDSTDWIYLGGGGFSAGMTTGTNLTYSPSGVPYVVYSDNENSLKATVMKYDDTGVGINELNGSRLLLYPNPTSENITIETPVKGALFIHNLSGQQLLQQEITKPKTTIDVSTLPRGVYFVQVAGDNSVSVGKFVKQ